MIGWALLVLRVSLGFMFMGHGLQKAFGIFAGPGIKGFSSFLSTLGFSPAIFWAYVAAYVEIIGGLCLVIGVGVRTSSLLLLVLIIVAALKVHIAKGFFISAGGFEYAFIITAVCIVLIILGAGKFSVFNKF